MVIRYVVKKKTVRKRVTNNLSLGIFKSPVVIEINILSGKTFTL